MTASSWSPTSRMVIFDCWLLKIISSNQMKESGEIEVSDAIENSKYWDTDCKKATSEKRPSSY